MKTFDLFDDVGIDITLNRVAQFLNENKNEDLEFNISTLGGNLGQALAIYSLLKLHKGHTVANMIGHTASAGTIIALGCRGRRIGSNVMYLIHDSRIETYGTADRLRIVADTLEKNDRIMIGIYKKETGLDESTIIDLMKKEDWLTSEQAIQYGFADSYIEELAISARYNSNLISKQLITKLENKMNLFGKKEKASVFAHVLSDDSQILASTEVLAEGTEVQALGVNAEIPDGEYTDKKGNKFKVKGGKIEKMEEEVKAGAGTEADAIIASVSEIVASQIASLKTELDSVKAELAQAKASKSTHKPPKGEMQAKAESKTVDAFTIEQKLNAEIQGRIKAKREE